MLSILFDLLRWFTALAMAAGVLSGLGVASLLLIRKTQPIPSAREANWLFAALLVAMSLTLLDKFLNFTELTKRHPSVSVLPIYLSFAFGPFLFYYVKSRLYSHFDMKQSDFKHFILPTVQIALLGMMTFRDAETKASFRTDFFSPFYGNFEKGVFIMQFFLYLYFSYRFILHERFALMKKRKSLMSGRRHVLVVGWLKRMVKGLFILFGIHASFILTDYFSYRLFDLNLQTKTLFSVAYELSFTAMLAWLCLNAFFALRRKL
jgi:hypothetical protein